MIAATFYGSVKTAASASASAWALGDIVLGLMIWLNLIVFALLSKKVFIALKDYKEQKK
jgi:alanine or glycine:cation symporter, AGCS family